MSIAASIEQGTLGELVWLRPLKTVLGILLKVSGRSFQAFDVNHGEEE